MIGVLIDKIFIRHYIARPDAGYPKSEARYHSVSEYMIWYLTRRV